MRPSTGLAIILTAFVATPATAQQLARDDPQLSRFARTPVSMWKRQGDTFPRHEVPQFAARDDDHILIVDSIVAHPARTARDGDSGIISQRSDDLEFIPAGAEDLILRDDEQLAPARPRIGIVIDPDEVQEGGQYTPLDTRSFSLEANPLLSQVRRMMDLRLPPQKRDILIALVMALVDALKDKEDTQ